MTRFDIRHRFTDSVIFTAKLDCAATESRAVMLGKAVAQAMAARANLSGADLTGAYLNGADLTDANLTDANLTDADLTRANLTGAYLTRADLTRANLTRADLTRAYLNGADLTDANLPRAYLTRADLTGAYLTGAYLTRANLTGAYLTDANLTDANLNGANLTDAAGHALAIAKTRILPEGTLIGWKACQDRVLAKLRIPENARRSHALGRKCRAEFVDVLEVVGADHGVSRHDWSTVYRPGERVTCHQWEDDWKQECAGGIHFFITREEAEALAA